MKEIASIFSQLLAIFSRAQFETAVLRHDAERGAKGFDCWTQFVAMLFCQLGRAHSLREICGGKLQHLGVGNAPARSTLSYANAHRPARLLLVDEAAGSGTKTEYKAGSSHYYLVEIRPNSSTPAKAERLDAKDLLAFSVKDGTGTYRVAFNPGEKTVSWTIGQMGVLHRTGEKFRADWLKEAGPVESAAPQPAPATFPVPAGEVAFVSGP